MQVFTNEPLKGPIDGKNRLFELPAVPIGTMLEIFVREPEEKGFTLRLPGEYYVHAGEFIVINPAPVSGTQIVATFATR